MTRRESKGSKEGIRRKGERKGKGDETRMGSELREFPYEINTFRSEVNTRLNSINDFEPLAVTHNSFPSFR